MLNSFAVSGRAAGAQACEVAAGEADGAFQAWPSISRGHAGKAWRVDVVSLLEQLQSEPAISPKLDGALLA